MRNITIVVTLLASLLGTAFANAAPLHPLVVGKTIRDADVNSRAIGLAFDGQLDGIDIPFQTGVVKLQPSPDGPQLGLLFPRVKIKGANRVVRHLSFPSSGNCSSIDCSIDEIIGASITRRTSLIGHEILHFSNGAVLTISAPLSDLRILMYVEDPSQGGETAILWDVFL